MINKIIITLLFTIPSILTQAQNDFKKIDEKYGFKDIKFEMQEGDFVKSINSTKIARLENGLSSYSIIDEKYLKVGDCNLSTVRVTFFKERLMTFIIIPKGGYDVSCLFSTVTELFGPGFKSNQYIEDYAWLGKKAFAIFSKKSTVEKTNLYMSSEILTKEYEEFKKTRAKSNTKDF